MPDGKQIGSDETKRQNGLPYDEDQKIGGENKIGRGQVQHRTGAVAPQPESDDEQQSPIAQGKRDKRQDLCIRRDLISEDGAPIDNLEQRHGNRNDEGARAQKHQQRARAERKHR